MTCINATSDVETLLTGQHCYLIRKCLRPSDQYAIYQDVLNRSTDDLNNTAKPTCMYPSPKTIIFDGNQSTLKFIDDNIYNQLIVKKANASLQNIEEVHPHIAGDPNKIKMSVGVIRYSVTNGNFPEHIDHCNDNSWVYLLSLGRSANFVVQAGRRGEKREFQFKRGDVLVFDPSSEAAIVHGVKSIGHDEDSFFAGKDDCISEDFRRYRYGVQCRVKMQGLHYHKKCGIATLNE